MKEYIESIVPDNIEVIAQGEIVANSLADYLLRHPWLDTKCSKNGSIHFLTTESSEEFDRNSGNFFDSKIASEHIKIG